MNYWDSVGRWINTLLVFIVGVLAFDALFRLLEANRANVIVSAVRTLSVAFLVPFQGMFGEQDFVLTTLIGVLGYSLLAGIALGVLRSLQASRAQPAPPVAYEPPPAADRAAPVTAARRPESGRAGATPASGSERRVAQPAAADGPKPRPAGQTPPPVDRAGEQDAEDDRASSSGASAPASAPASASTRRRERGDEQRRANGRQRRVRLSTETRDAVPRDGRARRRAGRRSASREPNG